MYGGAATVTTFLIAYPLAYTIAFKGGRYKNLLLFLVVAPFFTSFLLRTISWKILLGDVGPILGPAQVGPGCSTEDFQHPGHTRWRSSPASPTTSCRS